MFSLEEMEKDIKIFLTLEKEGRERMKFYRPPIKAEREYMNRIIDLLYETKQPHADVLCEVSYNKEENKKNMQALGSVIGLMLLSSLITYLVLVFML